MSKGGIFSFLSWGWGLTMGLIIGYVWWAL